MTLAREARLRLTALAQEFEDDGQKFCAADIRAALAEVVRLEGLKTDNTRWLGKMTDERLKQVRRDALAIICGRRQRSVGRASDLLAPLGDPKISIPRAAEMAGVTKGVISGLVRRAGGLAAVRLRYGQEATAA
jgi:hypothetical protein